MIPISKIRIGQLDARNEVFQQARENVHVFNNSFVVPPRVDINSLIGGSIFFIKGPKGSGKTALLWYLKHLFDQNGHKSQIILFKSDLTEVERQKIILLSDTTIFANQKNVPYEYDYKQNWLWFILRNFAKMIEESDVLEGCDYLQDLKTLMGVSEGQRESIFSGLQLTKIKAIWENSIKMKAFQSKMKTEIEAIKNEKQRNIEDIVTLCENLIEKVQLKKSSRFFLLFDELELFLNKEDQKNRDLYLIRDLLFAVTRFNRIVGNANTNMVVYASVRSEILYEINRTGPEVARDVEDFGITVDWNISSESPDQPLLQIIEKKIINSEIEESGSHSVSALDAYFPKILFGKASAKFLLDISMFKPRNLIRLLLLAQKQHPDALVFEQSLLNDTATSFSSGVWNEIEEELLTSFDAREVSMIKQALTGYKVQFTMEELRSKMLRVVGTNKELQNRLCSEDKFRQIIQIMYRSGALGNVFYVSIDGRRRRRDRWCFRGFDEPAWDHPFTLHESILKSLQLNF